MAWRDTPATAALAAVTIAVSVLVILSGTTAVVALQAGFVPLRVGADFGGGALPWALTPLTATLIHGGWMHLLFNIVMLGFCGREVERVLGWPGMVVLYVAGAFVSAAGQWLAGPASPVPMIGASGAISAVVGAYALLFGRRQAKGWGPVPPGVTQVLWLSAGWIGVQLLIGATEPDGQAIAIAAHIAGFLAGLALARPLLLWRWREA